MFLYADDILLTLTYPDKSIPALIGCIKEFGQLSGYKVNFQSEILALTNSAGKQIHWSSLLFLNPSVRRPKGI